MKKKIALGVIIPGIFILVFVCPMLFLNNTPEDEVFLAPTAMPPNTLVPVETLVLPKATQDPNIDNSTLASIMCEGFVLDRLKAPSSAEFPGLLDEWPKIMPFGGDTTGHDWHVVSYVDSQNTYGAMIRDFYTCQISYVGNDQWSLLDLWFHD